MQGLRSFNRKMKRIPERVIAETRLAMQQSAEEMVAMMRRLVPVDQGELLRSIGWTWGDAPAGSLAIARSKGPRGSVLTIHAGDATTMVTNSRGVMFQNALIQEFGTKSHPAQPFFYPSYRALRKRAKGRITRRMRKAIREGAR